MSSNHRSNSDNNTFTKPPQTDFTYSQSLYTNNLSYPLSNATFTPVHTPYTFPPQSNQSHQTYSNTKNLLSLSILNTQDVDLVTKLTNLANSIDESSILCCVETKLKNNDYYPSHINGRSLIHGKSKISARNGTSIILGSKLNTHLSQILSTSKYCSSIVLNFKGKNNILISSLYLPHERNERKKAVNELQVAIKFASKQKLHHIIAGDFNTYTKESPSINANTSSFNRSVYNHLGSYIDIGYKFDKKSYTHITSTSASRIDQIWISKNLATKVIWYQVQDNDVINSDHQLVSIKLDWFEFNNIKPVYRFKLEKTSNENIKNFTESLDVWASSTSQSSWEGFNSITKRYMEKFIKKEKLNFSAKN